MPLGGPRPYLLYTTRYVLKQQRLTDHRVACHFSGYLGLYVVLSTLTHLRPTTSIRNVQPSPDSNNNSIIKIRATNRSSQFTRTLQCREPIRHFTNSTQRTFCVDIRRGTTNTQGNLTHHTGIISNLSPRHLSMQTIPTFTILDQFIAIGLRRIRQRNIRSFTRLTTTNISRRARNDSR